MAVGHTGVNPGGLIQRARSSLLFIPILFVAASAVLAWLVSIAEPRLPGLPLVEVSPESARSVLATVAGATLTVAGIVLSITAVTIQLASSQYSPRLVQGFLGDRFGQSVVGLVVGTFVYSLLALVAVDQGPAEPAPSLAVSVAMVLAVAAILGIVSFIDRTLGRIAIDDTMSRIASATTTALERQLPEENARTGSEGLTLPESEPVTVTADATGWVQAIDAEGLLAALPEEGMVRLEHRVGDRVAAGEPMARVWGIDADDAAAVRRSVSLAGTRTITLDPSFGFRQLVDIALRALSPGINDPTTAADVVRHLVEPLGMALQRPNTGRAHSGEGGRRVYVPETMTHHDYVRAAFTEIRMSAVTQPYVVAALVDALDAVHHRLHDRGIDERCSELVAEAKGLRAGVETAALPEDVAGDLDRLITSSRLWQAHVPDEE